MLQEGRDYFSAGGYDYQMTGRPTTQGWSAPAYTPTSITPSASALQVGERNRADNQYQQTAAELQDQRQQELEEQRVWQDRITFEEEQRRIDEDYLRSTGDQYY